MTFTAQKGYRLANYSAQILYQLCVPQWFSLQRLNFLIQEVYKYITQPIYKILLLKNQGGSFRKRACMHPDTDSLLHLCFSQFVTTEIILCWKNVTLLTLKKKGKKQQNRPLLCLNSTGFLDQLSEVPHLYKAFKPV